MKPVLVIAKHPFKYCIVITDVHNLAVGQRYLPGPTRDAAKCGFAHDRSHDQRHTLDPHDRVVLSNVVKQGFIGLHDWQSFMKRPGSVDVFARVFRRMWTQRDAVDTISKSVRCAKKTI